LKLIDGKSIAASVVEEIAFEVEELKREYREPHLAVVMVGENPASKIYVRNKVKTSAKCGIKSTLIEMSDSVSMNELLSEVTRLNEDNGVDGILVQLPLPSHIDKDAVIDAISPTKDVDGFHPQNLGLLASDKPRFVPCTPLGILELLKRYEVPVEGKHAVIIGRSVIVGKSLALLLMRKAQDANATVTVCNSRTSNLEEITKKADILVAAVGKAKLVDGDMIKEGSVVIDVGMNRVDDPSAKKGYRLVGDVDFESASKVASLITPVPGGVGPMTVAMLMKNTLLAARLLRGL